MIEMKWSAGKFTGRFWEKITPSEKILPHLGHEWNDEQDELMILPRPVEEEMTSKMKRMK